MSTLFPVGFPPESEQAISPSVTEKISADTIVLLFMLVVFVIKDFGVFLRSQKYLGYQAYAMISVTAKADINHLVGKMRRILLKNN